ncbi:DNA binding domain-containing protein, excisionase family [Ruminococcaceae bacterium P7]|nr:DNA binding domain-containing protein, excisionase family [Ruminococcaceae bacterium P7]
MTAAEAAIFQKRLIKMIEYITTKEASEKWNISRRRVNTLCQEGKIPNVARVGNMWLIPSDSTKPLDGRSFKIPNNEVRRFCVSIEEIICEDFVVTADSIEKAIQVAVEKYQKEEFVLSPGNIESKQIMVYDKGNDTFTDWIEF